MSVRKTRRIILYNVTELISISDKHLEFFFLFIFQYKNKNHVINMVSLL